MKPNILLISIDSWRADFCSFINGEETKTPVITELAEKSAVFTNAIAPSSWTLQVHASIFTGLYPPEHGVLEKDDAVGEHPTIFELVSDQGYDTHAVARNGWFEVGDICRGSDLSMVETGPTRLYSALVEGKKALESNSPAQIIGSTSDLITSLPYLAKQAVFRHTPKDSKVIATAIESIRSADEPFCEFVHLNDTHEPYIPSAPYHSEYESHSLTDRMKAVQYQYELHDERGKLFANQKEVDQTHVDCISDLYRGCLSQADAMVGDLLAEIERRDSNRETIIVLFGDHGDNQGDNGLWGHQLSLSDDVIRVPLLIHDPTGKLPVGTVDSIVQLHDVYPTICSLLEMEETAPSTSGVDLLTDDRSAAYTYYRATDSFLSRMRREADVAPEQLPPQRQWAIWKSPEQKAVWFPDENRTPSSGSTNESLLEELRTHHESLALDDRGGQEISEATKQRLQRMGYL